MAKKAKKHAEMPKTQAIKIDLTNLPHVTNEKFFPLYTNKSRYLVLWGGAGSGKSVFAAQKLVFRCLSENVNPGQPRHKFLVVRKVAKTLRHSAFAEIQNIVSQWNMDKLFTVKESDLEIRCLTGNSIIFAGLDDVEKLKSISGITGVWVEEASELTKEDFQQLDIRLRGTPVGYHQIILTFNPVSITHWLKSRFFGAGAGAGSDVDGRGECQDITVTTHHSTYKDNKFIDPEYARVLESMRDQDPYYYTVYALGQWGTTGKTVYNAEAVTARLMVLREQAAAGQIPLAVGTLVCEYDDAERIIDASIRFVPDPAGPLTIYELPQPGYPYVIGGDTAEGGHDYSVGQVRNNVTWNQAAVWRDRTDTDLYAKQMYCLGQFYNTALIGIETNFDLHPVKELERLQYPRQYVREQVDTFTGAVTKRYGFRTDKLTRPLIIGQHVALAREHIETFNDIVTLEEMLTFVRDETGKPAAQEGQHDDTILADAIAMEIRGQQSFAVQQQTEELEGDAKMIRDHIKSLIKQKKGSTKRRHII